LPNSTQKQRSHNGESESAKYAKGQVKLFTPQKLAASFGGNYLEYPKPANQLSVVPNFAAKFIGRPLSYPHEIQETYGADSGKGRNLLADSSFTIGRHPGEQHPLPLCGPVSNALPDQLGRRRDLDC
jgi:hypothetical protein